MLEEKKEEEVLQEAKFSQLRNKTQIEDPERIKRGKDVKTAYIGMSKFGILNFKTTSRSRPGHYHYQIIEFKDLEPFNKAIKKNGKVMPIDIKSAIQNEDINIMCTCFIDGTKVLMANGTYKNIEDVEIGEYVITHTGNKQQVTANMKEHFIGNLVCINGIKSTPNHPYLVLNGDTMEWKQAKDITADMKLLKPAEGFNCKEYKIVHKGDLQHYVNPNKIEEYIEMGFQLGESEYRISEKSEISKKAFQKQEYLDKKEGTDNGIIYEVYDINSITTEKYDGNVYNLEVEEDHSYVVDNYIVKNCESFSYWAWYHQAYSNDYAYIDDNIPDLKNRLKAPTINNVSLKGALCLHLNSVFEYVNRPFVLLAIADDVNKYLSSETRGQDKYSKLDVKDQNWYDQVAKWDASTLEELLGLDKQQILTDLYKTIKVSPETSLKQYTDELVKDMLVMNDFKATSKMQQEIGEKIVKEFELDSEYEKINRELVDSKKVNVVSQSNVREGEFEEDEEEK